VKEDRIRELMRDQRVPDERASEERGWQIVRAAFGEREPVLRRRWAGRVAVALAAVLLLAASALTPVGEAVADWVRDAVRPGKEQARTALVSLPAPGRVLVGSQKGPWIVNEDGSKRLLGSYADASWSPHGLFVVAARAHELLALDPKGNVRWSVARSGLVHDPRWSPDGYRVAYLSGSALRVVAGDGTDDSLLARDAANVAPVWRPKAEHELAFADRAGRVSLINTDSSRRLWRSPRGAAPTQLDWSSDGRRLVVVADREVRLFDGRGRLTSSYAPPGGARAEAAAFVRGGHALALATYMSMPGRSRLDLVRLEESERSRQRLLSGAGHFSGLAWSPNGRWLLVEWPEADQWIFIRADASRRKAIEKLLAVANISAQFNPGVQTGSGFSGVRGWCCPP
jgi:WD40 repeat protein